MAALNSLSFSVPSQCSERKAIVSSNRTLAANSEGFRCRTSFSWHYVGVRTSASASSSRMVIHCMSASTEPATVSETKLNFLMAYRRPIPNVYNNILQELIVQQHLMRYKRTYRYDPVFALGFVTVYDQLMEGYPSDEDREAIFQAYIKALKEDPEQYRIDAQKLEEWARAQTASSLVEFPTREGEVEGILKDIAERAGGEGSFSYSRFFAVGLFRLLELANATEPTILEKACSTKNHFIEFPGGYGMLYNGADASIPIHYLETLCAGLNVNKRSVDRDLDVYRNLLSKLVQAKELLKEYMDREKKKLEERASAQKANEAVAKCLGEYSMQARTDIVLLPPIAHDPL